MWESNPPGTVLPPHTGFEDPEAHQLLFCPHIFIPPIFSAEMKISLSINIIRYTLPVLQTLFYPQPTAIHTAKTQTSLFKLYELLSTEGKYVTYNHRIRNRRILRSTDLRLRSTDCTAYLPRTVSRSSCCQKNRDSRTSSAAADTMSRRLPSAPGASGTAYFPVRGELLLWHVPAL